MSRRISHRTIPKGYCMCQWSSLWSFGSGQMQRRTLGNRLRAARLERGWSQQEVARRAGISATMVYRYETDRRHPSALALRGLAAVFERSVQWFYEEMNPEPRLQADRRFLERESWFHDGMGQEPKLQVDRRFLEHGSVLVLDQLGGKLSDKAASALADLIRAAYALAQECAHRDESDDE